MPISRYDLSIRSSIHQLFYVRITLEGHHGIKVPLNTHTFLLAQRTARHNTRC